MSPPRRRRTLGDRCQELIRRLLLVGTSVPAFLDQVDAFVATAQSLDPQEQLALEDVRRLCLKLRSSVGAVTLPVMAPGQRVWVTGHNPVSGGVGQFERQVELLTRVPIPPPTIATHFYEPSYTRRGHYFDMESLGYVVLASWRHDHAAPRLVKVPDFYRPTFVWLTMASMTDEGPGVEIAYEPPPDPPHPVAEVVILRPPVLSVRGTVIPELVDSSELSELPWLGLELTFGTGVDIGEFGFAGPIKSLIDAMSPVLGRDKRGGPADHRLHDLRIRVDGRDDGSVRARFWYCEE